MEFPPDKSAMIFEAFQQAEGSMDRPYEGTGLGLAIAKTLVEMMAGTIWLETSARARLKVRFHGVFSTRDRKRRCVNKKSAATTAKPARRRPGGRQPDPVGGRQSRKHDPVARVPRKSSARAGFRIERSSKRWQSAARATTI